MAPNIDKAYQWAINTCNAPNIGYSQAWRYQKTVNGITYYDCSSFIWYALKAGDFPLTGIAFTTRSMIGILLSIGFQEYAITGEWKPGDILWRYGHTEMVYTGGMGQGVTMGAHGDESDGYALPDQVSIKPYTSYASEWTRLFRYGNGATGGYGSDMAVISAICANFKRASNLNPAAWEGGTVGRWTDTGKGYGLGQWENLASAPTYGYMPTYSWIYGKYVGSNGNLVNSNRYAITEIMPCNAGDIIVNNTANYIPSGVWLGQQVMWYKTTTTLNDTYSNSEVINNLVTKTAPADVTGYRLQYYRTTTSGRTLNSPECETYCDVTFKPLNRLLTMHNWMNYKNYANDDGEGQVAFFQTEAYWLTTGPGAAWANDYPTMGDFLSNTTENLDTLTEIFFNCWRGLSSTGDAAELAATKAEALNILNFIMLHYNDPDAVWTARAAGITDDEANMNAVMIFNLLSAGIGGGAGIQPDYEILEVPKFLLSMRTRRPIYIKIGRG